MVIQPLSTRLIKPNFCFHPTLCKDLATSPAEKELKWAKTLRIKSYLGSLERVFLSLYPSDLETSKPNFIDSVITDTDDIIVVIVRKCLFLNFDGTRP